jgi:hypothetical protein
MLRTLLLATFAVPALLFSLAAQRASAQEGGSLAGQWKMVSSTPDGNEIPWTLTIHYKDGSYSASMSTGQGGDEQPRNFKVDGDNISLGVNYEGDEYEIKLKHSGDKLVGTWSGNGNSGDTKGERASST